MLAIFCHEHEYAMSTITTNGHEGSNEIYQRLDLVLIYAKT